MPKLLAPLTLLALLGLAGCDDAEKTSAEAKAGQGAGIAAARQAAEEQVRARLRATGEMRLRAIQVYGQQIPGTYAVCGQVNPTGAVNDPYIPWVAAVTVQDGKAGRASLVIGMSNVEASRVYIESIERCFEGGGPRSGQGQGVGALPPLPSDTALMQQSGPAPAPAAPPHAAPPSGAQAPSAQAPAAQAPATQAAPSQVPAGAGSVTTTAAHPVNIRSSPGGGGAVVRVVPRASALRVFGEAPGGWLQVGEDAPFGWVHESVLER